MSNFTFNYLSGIRSRFAKQGLRIHPDRMHSICSFLRLIRVNIYSIYISDGIVPSSMRTAGGNLHANISLHFIIVAQTPLFLDDINSLPFIQNSFALLVFQFKSFFPAGRET